jgi:hypothetical protein
MLGALSTPHTPLWNGVQVSEDPSPKQNSACCFLPAGYLLGLLFYHEDGGSTLFRNVVEVLLDYMT